MIFSPGYVRGGYAGCDMRRGGKDQVPSSAQAELEALRAGREGVTGMERRRRLDVLGFARFFFDLIRNRREDGANRRCSVKLAPRTIAALVRWGKAA